MKKIFNKKTMGLCGVVVLVTLFFLVKSYANKLGDYQMKIGMKINQKVEDSLIFPGHRQVAYWKIEDGKMGPWDLMRLAKDSDKMTLGEISKKLGQEPKYSSKSKLVFDGKEYDKMTDAMYEKNKARVKEEIQIKNLQEGSYLIKETDQSFKESMAKERIRTRVEYIGKESAPNGVLNLE